MPGANACGLIVVGCPKGVQKGQSPLGTGVVRKDWTC